MPKIIEYPRAPLDRAISLADAVNDLGGTATTESAAEKLGKKVSGSFRALVSGAKHFGLLEADGDQLGTSAIYERYKLAYTDEEQLEVLRDIALSPPLFDSLYRRFAGREIPDFLSNLLIREHEVNKSMASRVHGYFSDAMRQAGLLDEHGKLLPADSTLKSQRHEPREDAQKSGNADSTVKSVASNTTQYTVTFRGPGIDSTLVLEDQSDFAIVDAVLKKVASKIKASQHAPNDDKTGGHEDDSSDLI